MTKHKKIVFASIFLALGAVLPLFTGQMKEIGDSLLPMHLPVLLCGLVLGPCYGGLVGLVLPFFRSVVFGMPPLYPQAVWMAVELATYGGVIGFLYGKVRRKNLANLYACLICAMVVGRVTWGLTKALLLGLAGNAFTWQMFFFGGFVDAVWGIVLQLVLIPIILSLIQKKTALS